jgi:putative tryptophan/tyrosine transport system substrate-binding protein
MISLRPGWMHSSTPARQSLFIIEDPLTSSLRASVIDQASRLRLPTMTGLIYYVRFGGLITYGASRLHSYQRAAE